MKLWSIFVVFLWLAAGCAGPDTDATVDGAGGDIDVGALSGDSSSCVPECVGKECGDDGCGGYCGQCPQAAPYCINSKCKAECVTDCAGKECGADGCGGVCGTCPEAAPYCVAQKCQIECAPSCQFAECGDDGCGGSCGDCGCGEVCDFGQCEFVGCAGRECGPDGCGGNCGDCNDGLSCTSDACVGGKCVFYIDDLTCLVDGECFAMGAMKSGAPCQICEPGTSNSSFTSAPNGALCGVGKICSGGTCCNHAANCAGRECGDDGCGATCGECLPDELPCTSTTCVEGQCAHSVDAVSCLIEGECISSGEANPDQYCQQCAPDTEETSWSFVADGTPCPGGVQHFCDSGACVCVPACADMQCGADGCGGECGICDDGLDCTEDLCFEGECEYAPTGGVCIIGQTCVIEGVEKPGNSCQTCQPDVLVAGWSAVEDGQACQGGPQFKCEEGECVCLVDCIGKECGPDGCGGSCGACGPGQPCQSGLCFTLSYEWDQFLSDDVQVHAVTSLANGDIVVGGHLKTGATVDWGGGDLVSNGSNDIILARFTVDGTHVWSKHWGGDASDTLAAVTSTLDGDIVFTGNFGDDQIDFGGGAARRGQRFTAVWCDVCGQVGRRREPSDVHQHSVRFRFSTCA